MPLPPSGWHKSSYSSDFQEACVEAQSQPGLTGVLIRDSKDRFRPPLAVSTAAWHDFLSHR
ncbi:MULTISPECIES: DUF397 domain-containing protein [Streptomyces]|uniref:DUF397 domain-containing protein n=1 Tax=Streptomyces TaxID=1883 RepID=UPI00099D96E9|nr:MULTISPECIES: DUF397 domain-containing protein [Streptomyces]MBD3551408.1 DUF397 domain-containing protein [Streptomyces sp. SP18CM02]MCC0576156.1 DUF397 domain-containing protein [Streptomyces californicus]